VRILDTFKTVKDGATITSAGAARRAVKVTYVPFKVDISDLPIFCHPRGMCSITA